MNSLNEIKSWLQIAFAEPVDRINESYYFDSRNGEFYSVFITDYFLTDKNSTEVYSNSPYSKEELDSLSERIDRQEDNSNFILSIPRLTIEERKEVMQTFLGSHTYSNNSELLKIIDAENGRTNLDFNGMLSPEESISWQEFKYDFIQTKIDLFFNLHNIDWETCTLWTDKKMLKMTLDVRKPNGIDNKPAKKSWWKFW
ncbi:UPF0158 family protein [Flavitalea flava]